MLHREAKTFSHRSVAERWAKAREVALEDPSSPFRQNNKPRTLASLIRWYIETFERISQWRRTKPLAIGTSSPRRLENLPPFLARALPGSCRPEIHFHEIRGNVDSRLQRLFEPARSTRRLDGVVLAFAGLIRLWADDAAHVALAGQLARVRWMIVPLTAGPAAPGQGALAIECRSDDAHTRTLVTALHDDATADEIAIERALLAGWGGGCHLRFGATCVSSGHLGPLLHVRGTRPDGTAVAETRWLRRPSLARPSGTIRAWDGTLLGRTGIEQLAGAKAAFAGLEPGAPLFIANERALPEGGEAALAQSRIYVPGLATWHRLSCWPLARRLPAAPAPRPSKRSS